MPGRPRTTLKLLDDLLRCAESYGSKLYALTPPRYSEQPDFDDPVCVAWRQARQTLQSRITGHWTHCGRWWPKRWRERSNEKRA